MNADTKRTKQTTCVRIVVTGLGNIGRRFLAILDRKAGHLSARYRLAFKLVGAADSGGAAWDPQGLDIASVIELKLDKRSVAEYAARGHRGVTPLELVQRMDADALCEATPVDLSTGDPGLSCMREAMRKGMHVVTANKGPLVLAYSELIGLARKRGVRLGFCGTVAGGLPAINLGQRDLAGATIHRLEALPNLTTSFILDKMTQGLTYDQALASAQEQGCAEADPSLDVEGWDAASKLVILANSVLDVPTTLDDVQVEGITGVTLADLKRARADDQVIKLVASAVLQDDEPTADQGSGTYRLTVAPTPLPADHPLARLSGQQMGVVYHTDIYGTISAAILEEEPAPSAATMLRELLSIYADLDG